MTSANLSRSAKKIITEHIKWFKLSLYEAKSLKLGRYLIGLEIEKWNNLDDLARHAMTLKQKRKR
jgi:hypothetical protein